MRVCVCEWCEVETMRWRFEGLDACKWWWFSFACVCVFLFIGRKWSRLEKTKTRNWIACNCSWKMPWNSRDEDRLSGYCFLHDVSLCLCVCEWAQLIKRPTNDGQETITAVDLALLLFASSVFFLLYRDVEKANRIICQGIICVSNILVAICWEHNWFLVSNRYHVLNVSQNFFLSTSFFFFFLFLFCSFFIFQKPTRFYRRKRIKAP